MGVGFKYLLIPEVAEGRRDDDRERDREQHPEDDLFQALRFTIRNVKRFRGGLLFKSHILLCHSTLGLRVMKKMICSRL